MEQNNTKLKRVLGFGATYGAAMGLVVSGTAMFSVTQVAGQASHAVWIPGHRPHPHHLCRPGLLRAQRHAPRRRYDL